MSQNFAAINKAILNGTDVPASVTKDDAFYEYLLNNKVAFYYASEHSKNSTPAEEKMLAKGRELHTKYVKSLQIIKEICEANNFDYLLYKTYKYIPEVVDGDIDLLVREKDFDSFLAAFAQRGFATEEDEPGKGKCEKDDYCVIEPHINISWRASGYLDQDFIWENVRQVTIDGQKYPTASFEVETISILAKVLFEPSYFDLYSVKSLAYFYEQGIDEERMFAHALQPASLRKLLAFCQGILAKPNEMMPVFLPEFMYFSLWTKNFMDGKKFMQLQHVKVYFLHTIFFTYWKYRYLINHKLPFTHHHEW